MVENMRTVVPLSSCIFHTRRNVDLIIVNAFKHTYIYTVTKAGYITTDMTLFSPVYYTYIHTHTSYDGVFTCVLHLYTLHDTGFTCVLHLYPYTYITWQCFHLCITPIFIHIHYMMVFLPVYYTYIHTHTLHDGVFTCVLDLYSYTYITWRCFHLCITPIFIHIHYMTVFSPVY